MNNMVKIETIKNILKDNNLKATTQRVELLSVLSDIKKPITLKELMNKMKSKSVHEVTLYRLLASFKSLNIVRQIDFQDGTPLFELMDKENDHHHIVCTNCKKVSDFVGCQIDTIISKALKQTKDFSSIDSHSFELFGLCKNCAK